MSIHTVKLNETALSDASFIIYVELYDPDTGLAITPTTCAWSLRSEDNTEVASGTIGTPSESMEVALTTDDLALDDATQVRERRILLVTGNYSRSGTSTPYTNRVIFDVENAELMP